MPQYAIVQSHPPGDCPISSKGAREWMNKIAPQVESVAKKHGVKMVVPWLHLDPAHKGLMLVEAASAEAVRDFLVTAGLFHFLDSELYLTTPIMDLLKMAQNIPTIYP
jgi:hypothetical protein